MKKGFAMLLTLVMMMTMIGSVSAAGNNVPTFKVDGRMFVTPTGEPQPYINKDNRTMGSLRLIANAVGVESKNIKWDNAKQTATLVRGENTVSVTVGKKAITVNGKSVTMDTVAEMKQGRVFIPARFIGQGLGVTVKFDGATNSVLFLTKDASEVSYDNFEDMGFKRLVNVPFTQETTDGLKLTVHSAYLYKTSSAEAKALQKKYDFYDYDKATDILFLNFTLENNTGRIVQENYHDMNPKMFSMSNMGMRMEQAISSVYTGNNNEIYIRDYRLENGERITSNIAFLNVKELEIDFVGVGVGFKAGSNYQRIAEKVN
ncbi:copper amine oxidase N-terminal domain-containing protein [Paenibacillus septentrionalis]|uniref:Copper amine oxidase N-terminal domain-containing protein n=1 Tax=Paenibacillus septentrionalis TaxID=429342 RepID=A0ABW1V742_9BACL